jgi:hypothetical protein
LSLGVLDYDTKIALVVRVLGWCGMIGCAVWLALRLRAKDAENVSIAFPKPAISLVERYPGKSGTRADAAVSNGENVKVAAKPDAGN